jgi:hypothetical protein
LKSIQSKVKFFTVSIIDHISQDLAMTGSVGTTVISLHDFIVGLPKAELHLHIEGTLEPALLLELAHRNNVSIKHDSGEKLQKAYQFENLQSFLDI